MAAAAVARPAGAGRAGPAGVERAAPAAPGGRVRQPGPAAQRGDRPPRLAQLAAGRLLPAGDRRAAGLARPPRGGRPRPAGRGHRHAGDRRLGVDAGPRRRPEPGAGRPPGGRRAARPAPRPLPGGPGQLRRHRPGRVAADARPRGRAPGAGRVPGAAGHGHGRRAAARPRAEPRRRVRRPGRAAAEAAGREHVQVFTVALGTPGGALERSDGSRVPVPPDAATLQRVAELTGGRSFTAPSSDELAAVYRDLGSRVTYAREEHEVTAAFLGGAVALLLAGAGMSLALFRRLP